MSPVVIGLVFTAASLVLFGISWFLAMSADRKSVEKPRTRPLEDWRKNLPPSGNDDQISRLERSGTI